MTPTLAVSHIFVVSEDLNIVDLGEYSQNLLHIIQIPECPPESPDMILEIEHPSTKTTQVFVTDKSKKIPITDIFSCSNKNGDCIIMGSMKNTYSVEDTTIIIIEPYTSKTVTERMNKEVDVLNKLAEKGARYFEKKPDKIPQRNLLIERMKQVQL
ncbi:MAG: hypothetical protein PHW62_00365 [Candidatus Ratteibacteria bacterium]|nr:hypothetical protein [Candidatus Ratteibacteria bacterium]